MGGMTATGAAGGTAASLASIETLKKSESDLSQVTDEVNQKHQSLWSKIFDGSEKAKGSVGSTTSTMKGLGRATDEMGGAWGGLLAQGLGIGVMAGAAMGMKSIVSATESAQTSLADLNVAFRDTGQSLPNNQLKIFQDNMSTFGHTEDDANEALAHMVTITKSTSASMGDMSAVADLAARNHESLTDAAKQFTLAAEGNIRNLKDIGIAAFPAMVSQTALANSQKAVATATQNLNDKMASQPDIAAKVEAANQRVTNAEAKYQEQVTKGGATSIGAMNAEAALTTAREAASKAGVTNDTAITKAHAALSAAQAKLADDTARMNNPMNAQAQLAKDMEGAFGGLAHAQSITVGGAMAELGAKFNNMMAQVGQQLIPMIQDLAKWFGENADTISNVLYSAVTGIIGVLKTLGGIVKTAIDNWTWLGPIIYALVAAFAAYKLIVMAVTAQQAFMSTAMLGTPIGPIVLAIGALIAIGALLLTHLSQVGDFFKNVWKGILDGVGKAIGGIGDFFKALPENIVTILGTGIGLLIKFFTDLPGLLVTAITSSIHFLWDFWTGLPGAVFTLLTNALPALLSFFNSLPGALVTALGDVGGAFISVGQSIVGGMVKGVYSAASDLGAAIANTLAGTTQTQNRLNTFAAQSTSNASLTKWLGGMSAANQSKAAAAYVSGGFGGLQSMGFKGYSGGLATGGIVMSPVISAIGEAGPEAVIPLAQMGKLGGTSVTIDMRGSQLMSDRDMDMFMQKLGAIFVQQHLSGAGVSITR